MNVIDRLFRFKSKPELVENSVELSERIDGIARSVLCNSSGEVLIKHLIKVSEIDAQVGCRSGDEAIYINGKQDMMKYILNLITPED